MCRSEEPVDYLKAHRFSITQVTAIVRYVEAQCPPASSLTQPATSGSQFGNRQLINECCVKVGNWRSCHCSWGMRCCPNSAGTRICVSKYYSSTVEVFVA